MLDASPSFGHYALAAAIAAYSWHRIFRLTGRYGAVIATICTIIFSAPSIYARVVLGDFQHVFIKYISYLFMSVFVILVVCDIVRRGWFARKGPNDFWHVEKILFGIFLLSVFALSIQTGDISTPLHETGVMK